MCLNLFFQIQFLLYLNYYHEAWAIWEFIYEDEDDAKGKPSNIFEHISNISIISKSSKSSFRIIHILAKRLGHIQEYYFSRKLKEVGDLIIKGNPIINLGIGSPDIMPPKSTTDSLVQALESPIAHKYQSYKGIESLRLAIKSFYLNNYNVELNHNEEILPLIGSKEGIMHISLAFLDTGDEVLIPNPGYPTYTSVSKIVGAKPKYYELSESIHGFQILRSLKKWIYQKSKLCG